MKVIYTSDKAKKQLKHVCTGETFHKNGSLHMMIKTSNNGFAILELETSCLLSCFNGDEEVKMIEAVVTVK